MGFRIRNPGPLCWECMTVKLRESVTFCLDGPKLVKVAHKVVQSSSGPVYTEQHNNWSVLDKTAIFPSLTELEES